MKSQKQDATGLAAVGRDWLRAMAGLPAARVPTRAQRDPQDWLGWDGWVTIRSGAADKQ